MRKCLKKNHITEIFSDALGVPLLGKGLQVRSRHSEVYEQGRCLSHAESNDGLWRPSGFGGFPLQGLALPEWHLLLLSGQVDEKYDLRVYQQRHLQPNRKHYLGRRWQFFGRLLAGRSTPQLFEEHSPRVDQRVCCSIPGCFWPLLGRIRLFLRHFRVLQCLLLPFCEGLATV